MTLLWCHDDDDDDDDGNLIHAILSEIFCWNSEYEVLGQ